MQSPYYFRDEQIKGIFKKLIHDHYFSEESGYTIMRDHFLFEAPFGLLGSCFNKLILTNYLRGFLVERNNLIKEYAESRQGVSLLSPEI